MWRAIEEFRRASGPVSAVLLIGVLGSLGAAGLLWLFAKLTSWWWAVVSVAVVLALLVATLRAWHREWKRAEEEVGKRQDAAYETVSAIEDAAAAKERLKRSEQQRMAIRLVAEYLSSRVQGGRTEKLATRLLPYSAELVLSVPEEERYGDNRHTIAHAHGIIFNHHHGNPLDESVDDAVYFVAAHFGIPHLLSTPPEGQPPTAVE